MLDTGVAALVKGLPAIGGGSVDLMLKRIDADSGRRVLALAKVVPASESEAPETHGPPIAAPASTYNPSIGPETRFGRAGPSRVEPEAPRRVVTTQPPFAGIPPDIVEPPRTPRSREESLAAEPIERSVATATRDSFQATLDRIGLALQSESDAEDGLDHALRDASVGLGCSTASLMLRRNRTSVVEVTYGMPAEYRGLRFRERTRSPSQDRSGDR